jgi:DNA-binding NtrC family response regulator
MRRYTILIVDDDIATRFGLSEFLRARGFEVCEAKSCSEAERILHTVRLDAVVCDLRLPDGDGLEVLARLRRSDQAIPFIILTGYGTIEAAVQAIKEGAEQFLTKPVELSTLAVLLERVLDDRRNRRTYLASKTQRQRETANPFWGTSPAILELASIAKKVSVSDSPILIIGETGAGKQVLAQWLHQSGLRGDEPFIDLNCAGLMRDLLETELFGHEKGAFTGAVTAKPGLLEVAHRGTLFLDEIGDMDPAVQPKLLKVLEEKRFRRLGDVRDRHVDVRLIAATHHDLKQRISENKFRDDLYFRISTVRLRVPPLRDRRDDIPALAEHLLTKCAAAMGREIPGLSQDAVQLLKDHHWPGNIRELRNVLEHALLLCESDLIRPRDLSFLLSPPQENLRPVENLTLEDMERRHIESVLRREQGNVEKAAALLDVPRSSLYQKIQKYGLRRGAAKQP